MSQIFDALQRSQAERHGRVPAANSNATDLLQRAEAATAEKSHDAWTTTLVEEAEPGLQEPVRAVATALLTPPATQPSRTTPQPAAVAAQERIEGPMQCETLSISAPPENHLVTLPDSESAAGEAFHLLGVRLRHLRRQRPLKKVLITSTIPQEGKSMVAANLACTLALRTQQKVLLLEGDIRRPTQSRVFGFPAKPGICSWLNGERSLISSMYRLERAGIWILPAGTATGNSLELLQSGRVVPMMEQLTNWFDWVVIDSPPILPLADTSVWTNLADGILLVTRQGVTQKRQLKRGLEALATQKVIGAVMNSSKGVSHTDYYYRPESRLPNDDADA